VSKCKNFKIQLENLRHEADEVALYVYSDMAIQHAASQSKNLLYRLNKTPRFWRTCGSAFQTSAYISLGRVFDKDPKTCYTIWKLLDSFESNLHIFQRNALADRKRGGNPIDPPWLDEYLDKAYYPSLKDVIEIRDKVTSHAAIYERIIKPARNKYIAHREKQDHTEVNALFARGKVEELWTLSTFLIQLNSVLWGLLENGTKPDFRPIRQSVDTIFDSNTHSGEIHELIVRDVKELMHFLDKSTLNPSI